MLLERQYNQIAEEFVEGSRIHNHLSRSAYYSMLDFDMSNKKVLDVGCGDGYDLQRFSKSGALTYGIDSSEELVNKAKKMTSESNISLGLMENLPYQNEFFDVVLSKYVLQTSRDLRRALNEMDRVLKPQGILAYLAVHPIRQFLEKKKHPKDYFQQEIVISNFFGGTITAYEPSHALEEYLNSEFLSKYRIQHFSEHPDFPSSERIDGDMYPCFFLLKAAKKK